jgi:hypothetical protein
MLLLLDTVVSVGSYFAGKYLQAESQDVLFFIGALQPVFVMVIHGITAEDVAQMNAGTHLTQMVSLDDTTKYEENPQ